jgi:hypothetical protein
MEHLPGVTLRHLLAPHRRLAWPLASHIGAEVAYALEAAHALRIPELPHGMVHRDLSPSNIMTCADGAVKLLDFGLARPAGREVSVSHIEGMLQYMPPEAAAGATVNHAVDVYAVGVVLYRSVTGVLPFQADNELALLNQILHGKVTPPGKLVAGIPRPLERLILRCMSRDHAQRPAAGSLAARLEELVAGQSSSSRLAAEVKHAESRASGGQDTASRPPRRGTWVAAATALLLLASAGVIGALLALTGPSPARSSAAAPDATSGALTVQVKPLVEREAQGGAAAGAADGDDDADAGVGTVPSRRTGDREVAPDGTSAQPVGSPAAPPAPSARTSKRALRAPSRRARRRRRRRPK